MATANEATDVVKCPICLEPRSELRKLPKCEQSFCEDCLVTYVERLKSDKELEDGIPCPICRTISLFPGNTEIRAWAQSLTKTEHSFVKLDTDAKVEGNKCESCEVFGIKTEATKICSNCFELFCVPCSVGRHSSSFFRNHKVMDLKSRDKEDDRVIALKNDLRTMRKHAFCNNHSAMELRYLCKDDGHLCCTTCLTTEHHQCQNIHELKEDELAEMKSEGERLKDDIDKMSAFVKDFIDAKVKNSKEIDASFEENTRQNVKELKTKIMNMLDALEEKMVEQAKAIVQNENLSGEKEIEKLNEAITFLRACSSLVETVTKYGMVSHYYEVLKKTKENFIFYTDIISDICKTMKNTNIKLQLNTSLKNFVNLGPNDTGKLSKVVAKSLDVNIPLYQSHTLLRDYRIFKTSSTRIKGKDLFSRYQLRSIIFLPNNFAVLVDTRKNGFILTNEAYDVVSTCDIAGHSSCYMRDGTVGVSVPDQNEIVFLRVSTEVNVIRRMKTKKTPLAIQGLKNGNIAVAWTNPVAFGIISCDENVTERVYFEKDKTGRKLISFDYIGVDEERKQVIQPCTFNNAVYCFDYDGGPKFTYTASGLIRPSGVALDRDGNIYTCSSWPQPRTIHVISPYGRAIRIIPQELGSDPASIAFKNSGTEFAVHSGDGNVTVFKLEKHEPVERDNPRNSLGSLSGD